MLNVYAVIILVALLATFGVERWADLRNLRALRQGLPAEFEDVYDRETYERSQEYSRARLRLGLLTTSVDLVALLLFWWLGGFGRLFRGIDLLQWGPIAGGILYIGALVVAQWLIGLPFSVYATFVVEERFGFNRTTPATYVADLAKAALLAVLVGVPVLAAVLAFFTYAGSWAWVYAWVAAVVFSLVMQYVLPIWIMPLFNRFTPLESGELHDSIVAYARGVRFPLSNILVMDGSRRSTKANAFFTGFGRNRRIALFDTLIARHTTPQLVAVVAHEVGHYKERHVLKGLLLSMLHTGVLFALLSVFLSQRGLFQAFGVDSPWVAAGLVFFALLLAPVESVLGLGLQALSRRHEYQADAYAARTTGDADSMVAALKILSRDSLSNLTPDPMYVALNYSHPPVLERIRALRGVAVSPVSAPER